MIDKNTVLLNNILKNKTNYKFSNLSGDFYKFLLVYYIENIKENTVIILDNDREAENFYLFLKEYKPNLKTNFFPSFSINPYQKVSPDFSVKSYRINTLSNISFNKKGNIVITSPLALIQKTLHSSYLEDSFLNINKGDSIEIEKIVNFLSSKNYKKSSIVNQEGDFSVRGDILDICIPEIGPIRIDFFDNIIEKIKKFDILTQKSVEEIDSILIKPNSEIILNNISLETFKEKHQDLLPEENNEMLELLKNNIIPPGIENYLTLFYEKIVSILDYFDTYNIFVFDSFEDNVKQSFLSYVEEYNYLTSDSNTFKVNKGILPPNEILFDFEEISHKVMQGTNYILNKLKSPQSNNNINFDVKLFVTSFALYKSKSSNSLISLINFILKNKNVQFCIFTTTNEFSKQLELELRNKDIDFSFNNDSTTQVKILRNSYFTEGFIFENKVVLCETEITGIKKTFTRKKKLSSKRILQRLSSININDIVIHIKHGYGIYKGIKNINVNKINHDFLEIIYYNEEVLYVPVENIDELTKHSDFSEHVLLDKLGSSNFEKKKLKVKEKLKDIAYDLIRIAAQRNLKKAPIIDISSDDYEKFVSRFPFVATDDQNNAINDVFDDLTSGNPADRLICGDVGFGKTEVILRAAFLVANSGYQVAVITPTTILCNQHYNNFTERFKDFSLIIKQLSRFSSPKDRKQYKEDLKEGKIDIIIGTHSLLSKDISFNNLGLIIVDEEQSFGVTHKEKLKAFKEEVHCLTLSATPIPRTTQLAFKGIKDLSLISTPPVDKLPILTYVLPLDYSMIKKAILRELERGGQLYFVCPRIADIHEIQSSIDKLDINLSYVMVHGQMSTTTLEKNMMDFKNKKYDILLSTNIIESGIDLTNVNTIIIFKSDLMGLGQLYQLRGRVGRGKQQAYAYLLYSNNKSLNKKAEQRLQILQNLDYLGASFELASYDLSMRGAGNLLGEEQSGHIKEIGSNLYQKLLEKEIMYIKAKSQSHDDTITDYMFSPRINLNIPILIPKSYISDVETTMEMYQRIGEINTNIEIDEIKEEMEDRFGALPYQVDNLLLSIKLKIAARNAFIEKISFGSKGAQLNFFNNTFPNVSGLLDYIQKNKNNNLNTSIQIKPDSSIELVFLSLKEEEKINLLFTILGDLQGLIK